MAANEMVLGVMASIGLNERPCTFRVMGVVELLVSTITSAERLSTECGLATESKENAFPESRYKGTLGVFESLKCVLLSVILAIVVFARAVQVIVSGLDTSLIATSPKEYGEEQLSAGVDVEPKP
jgi:hypothetical protein